MDNSDENDGIFVLGMSCRVGKANNIDEFWDNLKNGIDMVDKSDPRWPNKIYGLPAGLSIVNTINEFDYEFFEISKEKADQMDPQIRLLLEVATEAILDSGVKPNELSNKSCGVYTSVYKSEVQALNYPIEHCSTSMHASKLAKFFHLTGPSMCIDCACSSSLVATNLAFHDLRSNKTQYALITATSLLTSPNQSLQNFRLGMTSATGKCHSWDAAADGYVRSEGIFAVLLGRGNGHPRLYAEIIAGATNSDGYKSEGITYPSYTALLSLFRQIYSQVPLSKVVYMECHAPGTQAGDVAEAKAICEILKENDLKGPLLIGSSKSNIGHAEWAAGLASFIKAVLCLYYKCVPPNLNLDNPNPKIVGITDGTLIPVTELYSIFDGLVGVTAMGFGGSNCHLVLKEVKPTCYVAPKNLLLLCASRTAEGLFNQEDLITSTNDLETLALISQTFSSSLCSSMAHRRSSILTAKDTFHEIAFLANSCLNKKVQNTEDIFIIVHDIGIVGELDVNGLPITDETDDPLDCPQFKYWVNRIKEMYHEIVPDDPQFATPIFTDCLTHSTVYILATVCLLIEIGLNVKGCMGAGLSDLVAAGIDDCIYHHNILTILHNIANIILTIAPCAEYSAFEVDAYDQNLMALFPFKLRTISINTFKSTTIAIPKLSVDEILHQLEENGISFRPLTLIYPTLYTEHVRPIVNAFTTIVDPKLFTGRKPHTVRSDTWYNTRFSNVYGRSYEKIERISISYANKIFKCTTYLNSAIIKVDQELTKVHIGMRSKPKWVPDEDIYVDATSYISIVQAVALLYLKGFHIDPNVINNVTQPISQCCPNMAQFVQWKHADILRVPHWLQFSATNKQEKYNNSFLITWNGTLESVLYKTLRELSLRFSRTKETAIELYNLDLYYEYLNPKQYDQFMLLVFTTSKTFKAIDNLNSNILIKGNFRFGKSISDMGIQTNSMQKEISINHPIIFEIYWQGNMLEWLTSVFDKLQKIIDVYSKRLCVESFAIYSYFLPKPHEIGKAIYFNVQLTTGLCRSNGVVIKMTPINTSGYHRTSSNLNLPLISLDISDIASPRDDLIIEAHKLRCYQLKDSQEHNKRFVLVYCRKTSNHNHNIGINLITQNNEMPLIKAFPIPAHTDCSLAIAVAIPYILASSIAQKVDNEIDNLMILSRNSDYLLLSLLAVCQSNAKNVYSLVKDDKQQHEFSYDRSVSSKISDSCAIHFVSDRKSADYETISNISTTPITSTSSKDSVEILEEKYFTPKHLFNLKSPSDSFIATSDACDELFSNVSISVYDEKSIATVKSKLNNKIRNIVNIHSDLSTSAQLLCTDGTLIHMGEVDVQTLGIGICAQYGTIRTLNPINSLTKFLEEIDESSPEIKTDFFGKMWEFYNATAHLVPIDCENNTVYSSSNTVTLVVYVDLNVIIKQLQKCLTEKTIRFDCFKDLDWLGKVNSVIKSAKRNKTIPVFQSPEFKDTEGFTLRMKTSVPLIQFASHFGEERKLSFDWDSPINEPYFNNLTIEVPLLRYDQPVLVKMNDVEEGLPVFLVHPVTGALNILRDFALKLHVPCYGLQQVQRVQRMTSLEEMANFYVDECRPIISDRQLQLIGYSYGACIAYVMAIEAQKMGMNVSDLVMLDGSPDYVKMPLTKIHDSYPPEEVKDVLETEMLLAFLQIYGNVEVYSISSELLRATNIDDRVKIAVKYLTSLDSPKAHNRWQKATRQILDQTPKLFSTAKKVLYEQRIQRAYLFLRNMNLVDHWNPNENERFNGDVYLFRVQDSTSYCPDINLDYGLAKIVSGKCVIQCYKNVNHESIVGPRNSTRLVNDIEAKCWKKNKNETN